MMLSMGEQEKAQPMSTGLHDDDERLHSLRRRIDEQRRRRDAAARRSGPDPRVAAHHLVLRLLADLGVALAAGLVLGWGIDRYFGTQPWGMLAGMLLGIAAGVRNVMHTADSASRARSGNDAVSQHGASTSAADATGEDDAGRSNPQPKKPMKS